MKKLGYLYKEKLQDEFKNSFESKNNFFIISYLGTKAADFSTLRTKLRKVGTRALVTKNTLINRVLKEKKLEETANFINGPTAFIVGMDNPILVSKILVDFSKDCKTINLLGGFLENRIVDSNELKRISEIPSIETLHYMLCNSLESPIRGFVSVLSNNIKKFLCALNQIAEKRR